MAQTCTVGRIIHAAILSLGLGLACLSPGSVLPADQGSAKGGYVLKVPFGLEAPDEYIPKENPLTQEKVELGKLLFFDPRLSQNNTISCATCHIPQLAWTDGQPVGVGIHRQLATRNTQTILNRLYSKEQLWHGKMPSLEAQAQNPLAKPVRMGMPSYDAEVAKLNAISGYRERFRTVFGTDVTIEGLAKAIAAFERTILSGNSPADRFDMGGEETAISESAKRGLTLFQGKARCTRCHSGFNFTDEKFHNLGIDWDTDKTDLGRYLVSKDPEDVGAFKTPTIREIARTAPYMHDGRFATLEEVVDFYDRGGIQNPHLSNLMVPLHLTEREKNDLVAYMKALNGEGWQVEPPTEFPR
ncbi:MAG: c-type cytochrome [Nitrospirota bacterium]|nr:c-type cytochrome [Nitrospirota bacterium]MDE3226577.1 c-type cytochrome [Nitrospirota bacterium]MDE3242613.1 c-type cytochrome [Nitrospirota bacterium]